MRPLVQVQPGPPDRLSPAEMPVGDRCRSRVLAPLLMHSGHRAHYSRAQTDPADEEPQGQGLGWFGGSARPMPRNREVSVTAATLVAGQGRAGAPPQPPPRDQPRRAWRGCGRHAGWRSFGDEQGLAGVVAAILPARRAASSTSWRRSPPSDRRHGREPVGASAVTPHRHAGWPGHGHVR